MTQATPAVIFVFDKGGGGAYRVGANAGGVEEE